MERVLGIGGYFFRAKDPAKLASWYDEYLGVDNGLVGELLWWQERGPTVFAPFPVDTDYFGRPDRSAMINFRVRDLDAIIAQLNNAGIETDDVVTQDGVGRFSWAADPEGNRFELWEPAPDSTGDPVAR